MRVGNFSLLVPEGAERDNGHVCLEHGAVYTLKLGNHTSYRADAEVEVDGKPVGTFRLGPNGYVTIETPPDDPGKGRFTFHAADSAEAAAGGVAEVVLVDRGLVSVKFRPEKPRPAYTVRYTGIGGQSCSSYHSQWAGGERYGPTPRSMDAGGSAPAVTYSAPAAHTTNAAKGLETPAAGELKAGITTLTGTSDQRFVDVPALDYDVNGTVVINVRLVVGPAGPRPLKPARERVLSNAVPPAV